MPTKLNEIINKDSNLTLVMIIKDEQQGLARAIKSTAGLVRDIIISIDRESTDKSAEIAKDYGATIMHHSLNNDFSRARNQALMYVNTKWALMLDGHEFIKSAENLTEKLKSEADGLKITIEMENGTEFLNPRIMRNYIKYRGRIHEQQECHTIEQYPQFIIQHDRINGQTEKSTKERTNQRDNQMRKIMIKELKNNPTNCSNIYHLLLYNISRGKIFKAKRLLKKLKKHNGFTEQIYTANLTIGIQYLNTKKYTRAFVYIKEAEKIIKGAWDAHQLLGDIYKATSQKEKAIQNYILAITSDKGPNDMRVIKRKREVLWNNIGELMTEIGQYFEASEAFRRAYDLTEEPIVKDLLKRRTELLLEMAKVA